jgi:hypothetical protein
VRRNCEKQEPRQHQPASGERREEDGRFGVLTNVGADRMAPIRTNSAARRLMELAGKRRTRAADSTMFSLCDQLRAGWDQQHPRQFVRVLRLDEMHL